MGLDRNSRYAHPPGPSISYILVILVRSRNLIIFDISRSTPCGFCFVEYYTHAEAAAAVRYISGTKLDERIVRCDLDLGYRDGRQYGRGKSGGQVRLALHLTISTLLPCDSATPFTI